MLICTFPVQVLLHRFLRVVKTPFPSRLWPHYRGSTARQGSQSRGPLCTVAWLISAPVNLGNKELGAVVRGSLKLPFDADMGYLGKDKQTSAKENTVVDLYLTVKPPRQHSLRECGLLRGLIFGIFGHIWDGHLRYCWDMNTWRKTLQKKTLPEITRPALNCLVQEAF